VALTDAITGLAAEVVIGAWPSKSRTRRSSRFTLATGKTVVVAAPPAQFEGQIELFIETDSSRRNLQDLLDGATASVIQIRQPGGYEDVDCYVAVLGYDVQRYSQDGTDERRTVALDVVEVDGWSLTLVSAGYTLQDLADVYDGLTLQDLADDYATLLLLAQAELIP
jgi:hypothetical protein